MPKSPKKNTRIAREGKATIYDIAKEANVSTGTVSRALNNAEDIGNETRERILAISRRLGVRPRATVKRTHLAVILPTRTALSPRPPVDVFLQELLVELSVRGCALSAFNDNQMDDLRRWIFDGIFSTNWSDEVLNTLESIHDTPIVMLNRFHNMDPYNVVGWDHVAEGKKVGRYLLERGHERIAFMTQHPSNKRANKMRLQGLQEATSEAGFPIDEERVEMLESGSPVYQALQRIVESGADSIYIPGHSRYAIETMNILQTIMNIKVPKQISVIGEENPWWALIASPPLTAVSVPYEKIAVQAVDLMQNLIAEGKRSDPVKKVLDVSIIERKSVCNRRGS